MRIAMCCIYLGLYEENEGEPATVHLYYSTSPLSWQLRKANNLSVGIAVVIKFRPTYRSA